jgi:hypothetical protein
VNKRKREGRKEIDTKTDRRHAQKYEKENEPFWQMCVHVPLRARRLITCDLNRKYILHFVKARCLLSLIFDPENGNTKFLRTAVKVLLHAYLLDLHFGPAHGGIYSSKMSAKFYRPTRVHIPEVSTLHGVHSTKYCVYMFSKSSRTGIKPQIYWVFGLCPLSGF